MLRSYKFSIFFQMMGISSATLLPIFWSDTLQFDAGKIGWLNTLSTLISLIAPLLFGWISTHWAHHKVIFSCFILTTFSTLALLVLPSFFSQSLGLGLMQFMRIGYLVIVPAGVLTLLGVRAAKEYGYYRRIGSIGFLIGVIGTGWLSDIFGAQVIPLISGVATVIAAIPFLFQIRSNISKEIKVGYAMLWEIKLTRYLIPAFALISSWSAAAFIFLPVRMREMEASGNLIGWTVSMCGILALITLVKAGQLADHFNPKKLYLLIPIAGALRMYAMSLPEVHAEWFLAIQFLHIPAWVLGEVIQMKLLKEYCPKELFPRAQAAMMVAQSIGIALCSGLIAVMSNRYELKESLAIAAVLPLLALPFVWMMVRAPKLEKGLV
jgi:predicted MFS family arabinose efflux permease